MPNIGQVKLTGINVEPAEVTPGGVVRVTARLTETAEYVGPFGQLLLCDPEGLNPTGLEVETVLQPDWSETVNTTVCIPASNIGAGEADVTFTLTAPQDVGQYEVKGFLRSTKDRSNESGPISSEITVSDGSGARDDYGDGGRTDDGYDFPEPNFPDGEEKSGLSALNWATNNPLLAVAAVGGTYIVVTKATETATEEIV